MIGGGLGVLGIDPTKPCPRALVVSSCARQPTHLHQPLLLLSVLHLILPPTSDCPFQPKRQHKSNSCPFSFESIWPLIKQHQTPQRLGGNAYEQNTQVSHSSPSLRIWTDHYKGSGLKVLRRKDNTHFLRAHAYKVFKNEPYPKTRTRNQSTCSLLQRTILPAERHVTSLPTQFKANLSQGSAG